MRLALSIIFIIVFVWIISVLVALTHPGTIFGPVNIISAVIMAVIILAVVEIVR